VAADGSARFKGVTKTVTIASALVWVRSSAAGASLVTVAFMAAGSGVETVELLHAAKLKPAKTNNNITNFFMCYEPPLF
jgi:hypothetical protein